MDRMNNTKNIVNEAKNGIDRDKKKNSFAKNVMMLVVAQLLVKIFGFVYRLVIVNIPGFGNVGSGYFAAGYQVYTLMLAVSSIGLPSVVSRFVSQRLALGDKRGAQRIYKICVKMFVTIGAILSILLFISSEFIAEKILNIKDVAIIFRVLAPAIFMVSSCSMIRGYFEGMEDMKATSNSQMIEQLFNCIFSIIFVKAAMGKEAHIMAAAGNFAATVAICITFIYLLRYYSKNKIKKRELRAQKEENPETILDKKTDLEIAKEVLKYSIPITLGSIVSVLNSVIDTTTVSRGIQKAFADMYTSKKMLEEKAMEMQGILGKVETITALPLAINLALYTAIIPSLSSAKARGDKQEIQKRVRSSFAISCILIFPAAVGLFVMAEPILKILYPAAPEGAGVMALLSIALIFTGINQIISASFHGLGKTKIPMFALISGATLKIILNTLLVSNPKINIYGAVIGSIACQVLMFLIGYPLLKKEIDLKIDATKNVIKPMIISIFMGVIAYFCNVSLTSLFGKKIALLFTIIIAAIIYFKLIFVSKVVLREDIEYLVKNEKIIRVLEKLDLID